ncbi:hypothetical protein AB0J83_11115 [Actinoplanes sp. NPDC049596]|uniref:hypothetical protein n=1 Tax=unclassified Actinoplanes TaxID=2626549 RepID=UPI00341E4053
MRSDGHRHALERVALWARAAVMILVGVVVAGTPEDIRWTTGWQPALWQVAVLALMSAATRHKLTGVLIAWTVAASALVTGVVLGPAGDGSRFADLLRTADRRMYHHKHDKTGRLRPAGPGDWRGPYPAAI